MPPVRVPTVDPVADGERAKTELFMALWKFSRDIGTIDFTHMQLTQVEREDIRGQWNALVGSLRRALDK
jgi:hypothetical protein